MCTDIDDNGAFYLSGHFPTDDTYRQIRRGTQIESKSVCKKLTLLRPFSWQILIEFWTC